MSYSEGCCKGSCISEMQKSLSSEVMDEFIQVMQNCESEEKIFEEIKSSYLSEIKEIIALLTDKSEKLMLSLEEMFLNRQRSQTSFLYLCLMIKKNAINEPAALKCDCFSKDNSNDSKASTLKLISNLDKLKNAVSELCINLKCDHCEKLVTLNETFLSGTEVCMCSQPSADCQKKIHQTLLETLSKEGDSGFPFCVNYLKKATEFYKKKRNVSASSSEIESINSFEVIPQEDYEEIGFCDCSCKSSREMSDDYEVDNCCDSLVHSKAPCHMKDEFPEDNGVLAMELADGSLLSDHASDLENTTANKENSKECKSLSHESGKCDRIKKLTPADVVKDSFRHYFNKPLNAQFSLPDKKAATAKPEVSAVALKLNESAEKLRVNSKSSAQKANILKENCNKENVIDSLKASLNSYFSYENNSVWLRK